MTGRRAASTAATAFVATAGAAVATVAALLVAAAPASAHANLVRSSPADGATVTTAPSAVVLTFDENIRAPSTIVVTGPGGQRVDRGETRVVDNTASVNLTIENEGRYAVAFRVVSADGHPVAGQTTFTYGQTGAPASAGRAPVAPASVAGSGHTHSASQTRSSGRRPQLVAGSIAVLALLAGLALLIGRRGSTGRHASGSGRPT